MRNQLKLWVHIAVLVCIGVVWSEKAFASDNVVTFESGQVRPLALSPNGQLLFAVNSPDARLEVFQTGNGHLNHKASIPVGLEPVAVAARTNSEIWVVNHVSDSVSIVEVDSSGSGKVTRTLDVGDEPRDVVFAGAGRSRAFITTAHRGQNIPFDPELTTPGVGRADVWVYDTGHLDASLTGGPISIITLFSDTPRALAVSPDGKKVYAAGFKTGNQTTIITEFLGLPNAPPTTNHAGIDQPHVAQIVKFDGTHWVDDIGRTFDEHVNLALPDKDVFTIDAMANPPREVPSGFFKGVGTVLYNMAVNPVSGKIYVSNTDARNDQRFEGPGIFAGHSVRGNHNRNRITVLTPGGGVAPRHLNKHIDYSSCCDPVPNAESDLSLALPTQMAVSSNGANLYVAAMGSSKVGIYKTKKLEDDTFVPSADDQIAVSGGGPTGIVLDENRDQLYVLTRFDNAISVVKTKSRQEVDHVAMFNPEPPSITHGRPFLYNARLSAHGDSACATCHVFSDNDDIGWTLGDPDGDPEVNNNPFKIMLNPFVTDPSFAPMKGPMTTQSLRGLANHGPMHWRGDRTGSLTEPNAQPDSGAFNEREALRQFQAGFVGLLGRDSELAASDMQAYIDFQTQVMYPPNPNRNLDDSLTSDQAAGQNFFFTRQSEGFISCQGCHRLDPQANSEFGVRFPGFFGTDGEEATIGGFNQAVKIPHLRNLYTKIGMFGLPDGTPGVEPIPGQMGFMGDQIRGFGYSNAGDADSVFRFLHAIGFSQAFPFFPNPEGFPSGEAGDPLRRQVESFLFSFPTNHKPIVGQQATISNHPLAASLARLTLLLARADAGDCDLVARGVVNGCVHGYSYLGGSQFQTDQASTGVVPTATVLQSAHASHDALTFTCMPLGTGYRFGVDRDDDGVLNGDE